MSKRKRLDQKAERESLASKIDLFGEEMPVPCTACLLWNARRAEGEAEVICKMDLGHERCGECVRRGLAACDGSGLEDSDCLVPFSLLALNANFCSCLFKTRH